MTIFHLHENALSGSIPTDLGRLSNLSRLSLRGNTLTSTIPSELGKLTSLFKLHWLFLHNNLLTSAVPSEVGGLFRSFFWDDSNRLSLSINLITSVPSEIGLSWGLGFLLLDNNALTSIPSELFMLAELRTLALSNNMLSGQLQSEFGLLSNFEQLFLDGTNLTGPIPPEVAHLVSHASLGVLNIRNNSLPGVLSKNDICRLGMPSCTYRSTWYYDRIAFKNCSLDYDCSDSLCGCDACPC
ncbi:LRR receptor-like serine threonine-protein kinase [Seminavis robusta]|uniref:LRR receptor-like serine threonine-protein kinase n=1 Tax=Seminavis robusta TaxID=568900 RepID=A0A9N8H8V6_9STRA|nr:LRR receptor-like serine threonine-protein kinase [Seminavis robusta]|eukprot:Sro171_g075630.1 LRR receptor-like serine threonine-protein kinase (241) ;mRNA; f:6227-6949